MSLNPFLFVSTLLFYINKLYEGRQLCLKITQKLADSRNCTSAEENDCTGTKSKMIAAEDKDQGYIRKAREECKKR